MEGLSMICAGLGIIEEDEKGNRIGYAKSEHCSENLKDLLRFLRRDDPQTREVFKQVCKWNIVSKDLIPIIVHCQDDHSLLLNAVKVLVFLTMPIEPTSIDIPLQIEYLWGLKFSITCSDTVPVVISLLESPLENLDHEAFSEDDWKLVQLVLTLFRNILAVQEISLHQTSGVSATHYLSLRDRFLELLFRENVMDLIIVFAQHVGGSCGYLRQDNLLVLETFHHIFVGQEPELIAKAYIKEPKVDLGARASLNSLEFIMKEEEGKRKLARLRNLGRHAQFNGTFTRVNMDGSKALFKGNPTSASHDILLKSHKVHRGPSKRTVWDHGRLPSTNNNILELLHDFVNQFLSGGYNVLMQSIREDIEKEHHEIQNFDVVVFFQVAHFITSFQYYKWLISKPNLETDTSKAFVSEHADSTMFKGSMCGPIAATMNESMFLLVISRWRCAFDGLKETNDYKFLSAAGSVMKIMIRMLDLVLKLFPEDSKEPQTARILLYKLFYDQTEQGMTQFLLGLIKSFDTHKQPKSDLADLVEMIHVVVRLMEKLQAGGTLRVSKKSRKGRKKKPLSDENNADRPNGEHATIQNEFGISGSEKSVDLSMLQKENELSTCGDGKQEDFIITDKADEPEQSTMEKSLGDKAVQMDSKSPGHINDDLFHGIGDTSSDEELAATAEVDFRVSTLVSAFANNTIISNLCWLLSFYKSNSRNSNHYIICMLRRISEELDLSPMLYQLSLLTTFHKILDEQKLCPCEEYEHIVHFLTSLVRRMLRKLKTQPLLFVEILFWKTRKECHYINSEFLLHELHDLKKETGKWESVSGYENGGPLQGQGGMRRSLADALGDDEADFVISHDLDNQMEEEHNEANVQKYKNHRNGDDTESDSQRETDGKEKKEGQKIARVPKRKKGFVINEELAEKIKVLFEQYKDERHCSRIIAEALDPDGNVSAAQVSKKLKLLGFKVPTKKKVRSVGGTFDGGLDINLQRATESETNFCHLKDLEGNSMRRQPMHTRKRVRAFSEDEEMKIKSLFEQFKDHKRSSYMIANALDVDGKFTAAQVSRKLKQLGLRVPRRKSSKANMRLRDEDLNAYSTDSAKNSDDETLSSLQNRKNCRLPREKVPAQNIDGNLSGDDSDNLLCTILKKKKALLPKAKSTKLTTTSIQQTMFEDNSGNEAGQYVMERDGSGQPSEIEVLDVEKEVSTGDAGLDGNSEAEVTGISSLNHLGNSLVGNEDRSPQEQPYDELEDSGDDTFPSASLENVVTRRKRVVIDFGDEE